MNKRMYITPAVQFVYMTMLRNVCDNPNTGAPEIISGASGMSGNENETGAPARIKLYF